MRREEDLPLQVGQVDPVGVGEDQAAEAGCGEVERRRAAQAARADDERRSRSQPLLPLDSDLGEQDMAAIPEELLVVQSVTTRQDASAQFGFVVAPVGLVFASVGATLCTGSPFR